jgi:hypothetical protein
MADSRSPTTNLEDTSLVAFMVYKGHKINLWRCVEDPKRVSFDIEGDSEKIESDMQQFYNNEMVGIQDYTRCLKDVKSRMYNFKKIIKEEKSNESSR